MYIFAVVALQGKGERVLRNMHRARTPRKYRVSGKLGMASLNFTDAEDDKLTHRSSWQHISPEKIQNVLATLQGAHRNALIE